MRRNAVAEEVEVELELFGLESLLARLLLEKPDIVVMDEATSALDTKSQNKIQDPAKLKRLISDLIDKEQWVSVGADIKGDAYEGLLERNAQDTKSGAGQYFTPRELIKAIVDVMRPGPEDTVCDPACGTGGFLLAAHDYVSKHFGAKLDTEQKKHLRTAFAQALWPRDSYPPAPLSP